MPTTTWRAARRDIMRPFGLIEFNTTTNIAADQSIISTELQGRFNQNDAQIGWFATVVLDSDGGTPASGLGAVTRRVTDYVGSSGTLTVATPVLTAEDEAVAVDLYRHFHPADILRAYNRARQDVFPMSGVVRDLTTIVTAADQLVYTVPTTIRRILGVDYGTRIPAGSVADNLLTNAGFESWTNSTTPEDWTLAGSGASMNQEEATSTPRNYAVLEGNNSMRLETGSTTATVTQTISSPSVAQELVELNFTCWVYSLLTTPATVITVGDNSQVKGSSAHGGTGWEMLSVTHNTAYNATSFRAQIRVPATSATSVFIDEAIMTVGPSEPYSRSWEPVENFEFIPAVAGASEYGKLYLDEALPYPRRIRIKGVDMLSAVTVDTSTIEIDGEQLEPLYNLTRSYLCQEAAGQATGDSKIEWMRRQSEFRQKFDDGIVGNGRLRVPNRRLRTPDMVY